MPKLLLLFIFLCTMMPMKSFAQSIYVNFSYVKARDTLIFNKAFSHYHKEEYQEAIKVLSKLKTRKYHDERGNRVLKGICYYYIDKYDDAVDEFLAVLFYHPSSLDVFWYLASCMYYQDEYETAAAYFAANEIYADNKTEAAVHTAEMLMYAGRYDDAIKHVMKLEVEHPAVYNLLGTIYYEYLPGSGDALSMWKKALALNPDDDEVLNNLVIYYYDEENYEQAMAYAEQALSLYPEDGYAWYYRGMIHYALGNEAAARADFEQSKKLAVATEANWYDEY